MVEWIDPTAIIGVAQAIIALALVYFTISLAKSTEAYSKQVKRQTEIMERNNMLAEKATINAEKKAKREQLLEKYSRLTNEMINFIAPLYSRIGDMEVFNIYIPSQKNLEKRGQIDDLTRERYSFWENIRQTKYLNQSNEVRIALNDYLAIVEAYHAVRAKSPQTDVTREESNKLQEKFERLRTTLFKTMDSRHFQVQEELAELENELGIQETKLKIVTA